MTYQRKEVRTLLDRLAEQPRFLIFIAGPRQVGKTTLIHDALATYDPGHYHFVPVDKPDEIRPPNFSSAEHATYYQDSSQHNEAWLAHKWQLARAAARESRNGHILVLDEIQKIPNWQETVKGLWDADRAERLNLHVVLLGSSPLLMQQGMSESLTGRYELIRVTHWSFPEMYEAFEFDLEDYIFFGGYPGSATYIRDERRWCNYVRDALIQPSIERDILMMTRVDKPALLRQLFQLSCCYSGQILSYNKMLGQLQDSGNTVTLARYLDMLGDAGLIYGLKKYAGQAHRQRASSPKLNVLNNALMSAGSQYTKAEAKADRSHWGRLVESAVGAHLYNTGHPNCHLHSWRENSYEVDFVIAQGTKLTAIEVKSGSTSSGYIKGLDVFEKKFGNCRKLLVGENGIPITEFLSHPAEYWL